MYFEIYQADTSSQMVPGSTAISSNCLDEQEFTIFT